MSDTIDSSGTTKMQALITAANSLTDIIFGSADSLSNVHISIVLFDVSVPKYRLQPLKLDSAAVSERL